MASDQEFWAFVTFKCGCFLLQPRSVLLFLDLDLDDSVGMVCRRFLESDLKVYLEDACSLDKFGFKFLEVVEISMFGGVCDWRTGLTCSFAGCEAEGSGLEATEATWKLLSPISKKFCSSCSGPRASPVDFVLPQVGHRSPSCSRPRCLSLSWSMISLMKRSFSLE